MSPCEVLRAAAADLGDSSRPPHARLQLKPPADPEAVAGIERRLGVPLPGEIRELLAYASGFSLPWDHATFADDDWDLGSLDLHGLLHPWIALRDNGSGDCTFVDINPETGEWGGIWTVKHDAPSLWLEAPDLATWMRDLFETHREMARRLDLHSLSADNYTDELDWMYRDLIEVQSRRAGDLAGGEDPLLAEFCAGLDPDALVYDMRAAESTDWSRATPQIMCEFPSRQFLRGRFLRPGRSCVWALQDESWSPSVSSESYSGWAFARDMAMLATAIVLAVALILLVVYACYWLVKSILDPILGDNSTFIIFCMLALIGAWVLVKVSERREARERQTDSRDRRMG